MTTTSQRLDFLLGILKETPTDSFVIFAIAKEYENIGNQNEAIQYYHNLYQIDPDYVGLYFHWGKLHEEMNASDMHYAAAGCLIFFHFALFLLGFLDRDIGLGFRV